MSIPYCIVTSPGPREPSLRFPAPGFFDLAYYSIENISQFPKSQLGGAISMHVDRLNSLNSNTCICQR